jgi:hypothetical protein
MKYRALSALVFALFAARGEGAVFSLSFQSDRDDSVGAGQNRTLTYDTLFGSEVMADIDQTVNGAPAMIHFRVTGARELPANSFALIYFGTNWLGHPLQPGVYLDAQRAVFAETGHPGLDVSLQGIGCNRVSGYFVIHEVTFNSAGTQILTFSASFEQHCEGRDPALRGTVNYALNPVPEPSAGLLAFLTVGGWITRRRR